MLAEHESRAQTPREHEIEINWQAPNVPKTENMVYSSLTKNRFMIQNNFTLFMTFAYKTTMD
jgi:hypothetical protein